MFSGVGFTNLNVFWCGVYKPECFLVWGIPLIQIILCSYQILYVGHFDVLVYFQQMLRTLLQ